MSLLTLLALVVVVIIGAALTLIAIAGYILRKMDRDGEAWRQ